MRNLKDWSSKKIGHVLRHIERLRSELAGLQQGSADRQIIGQMMYELDELLYREEILCLQRSRITRLKEGERNTQYLHQRAVWRARRNYIQRLRKLDDTWCIAPSEMELMMRSYFQEVYTKDPMLYPVDVIECIEEKLTEMNNVLCAPFFEKEISDTLFQIGPPKAPGTDGFPA